MENNGSSMIEQILRVENPFGEVAKVILPVQDGDDLWTALDRAYPEAWDILEPKDIDVIGDSGLQLDRWDIQFAPGQGQALADWLCEIPQRLWPEVMAEVLLDTWDEGCDWRHPVQPGAWKGRGVLVTYEIEQEEDTAEWTDAEWEAHVVGIRYAEGPE